MPTPAQSLEHYATILAIDPSLADTGVAVLRAIKPGQPHQVQYARLAAQTATTDILSARVDRMVATVRGVAHSVLIDPPHAVIIELPRIHVVTRGGKADPADIIRLAVLVGALCQHWTQVGSIVRLIEPADWKGQTPKDVTEKRCRAILTESEFRVIDLPGAKTKQHNVWDAIGIGLWSIGRYG